ncbi:lysozyme [Pseudomonas palleroniana]|uniref:Lysozyme n=1 Tax=Pseudomonas palleroniana TaxID=191390 RepID=A0A1H5LNS8_9PSED|nr:lysozyme [Pseudomonas palleroniana]KAB0566594.1 lysozyme [Pseudomonas palleroniana]PTC25580.1 lysozyme [Pseudomonas palleroniana]SEE78713.1 Phage-related lysozyme (muramidase), GH24 family [Pseudomonas palleroniana]
MSLRGKIAAGAIALCSSSLMLFLGTWEGTGQNTVYADKLAQGLPTVCKGITRYTSPYPVVVGDYWSDARCSEVEQLVTRKGQLQLADCITNQQVGQGTFDALSSHAHNLGTPNTCASRAVALINAGRIKDGCNALAWAADGKTPVWAYVTTAPGQKEFVRGLHRRRLAEAEMCKADL